MTVTMLSLERLWVRSLYLRYCQWQHTIFYMVACRVESQLKPQNESLKSFFFFSFFDVTQRNTLVTKVSPVCFLLFECLCAALLLLKVKGQWNDVWRTTAPLGVKSNFEHRGHSRATPELLHLKTSSITVVRPWNQGCFSSLHVLLSPPPNIPTHYSKCKLGKSISLFSCNLEFDFIFMRCRCIVFLCMM